MVRDEKKSQKRQRDDALAEQARRVGIGVMIPTVFSASVIVGSVIGFALDRWFHTEPWLTLIFLGFGIGAGVREVVRMLRKMG